MIGTSRFDYVFIRLCILFLHWIAPLSTLYCLLCLVYPPPFHVHRAIRIGAGLEAAFFLFVYHPRRLYLQRAASHPPPPSRDSRRKLFDRCHENIQRPEEYLAKWFMGAPAREIKRENVKDFLRWAFFNTGTTRPGDEKELGEYIEKLEKLLGRRIEPGRGRAKCIRLTIDKVDMLHRSLTWYLCVFVVDTLASIYMRFHSFEFYRSPLRRFATVFPLRPFHLLSQHRSPAKTLTYWHRPHTSKTRLPVLFIHGIGIGLYPYVNFLAELNSEDTLDESDGQMGIIAVEIMPVSFRITGEALPREEMCRQIDSILKAHGWQKFVLVSHSYGSVVSTHLLRTPQIASRIGPVVFIDPVSFLLHLPDVAYNFTCRTPVRANEHQLHYFGSKDMGVAHTLGRRFFWSENILWKEDLCKHPVTVSLGAKDLIVDTETVRAYLSDTRRENKDHRCDAVPERFSEEVDVIWFPDLDHAQVFDKKATRKTLGNVVRGYCLATQEEQMSRHGTGDYSGGCTELD